MATVGRCWGWLLAAAVGWVATPGVGSAQGGWARVPGGLKQVCAGSAQHVWGVNRGGAIYRWTGRGWQRVPGGLSHVSVGADGTVWGVNRGGAIFRFVGPKRGRSPWQLVGGSLAQISVGNARHVWGVNRGDYVYRWTGGGWRQIPGRLSHVSVGADGTVWGVSRSGVIFRYLAPRRGGGGWRSHWQQMPGALVQISVGDARQIWGVNRDRNVYQWTGRGWRHARRGLSYVSVAADGTLWGLGRRDEIFRFVRRPAATVAAASVGVVGHVAVAKVPALRPMARPEGGQPGTGGGLQAQANAPGLRPVSAAQLRVGAKKGWSKVQMEVMKRRYGAGPAFGAILGGKQRIPTRSSIDDRTLGRLANFGKLVPIERIVEKLKKAEDAGEVPAGNPLIAEVQRWKDEGRRGLPPGHLGHSDKGLKLFQGRYLGRILPDLKNYVPYIADKVLLRGRKTVNRSKLLLMSDLLFKYGCKQISRLMPGFAKVVRKRISAEVDLLGNWEEPTGSSPVMMRKPRTDGKRGRRGGQSKKRVRIVEICTVTHKQLEETLRQDLQLIAMVTRMGRGSGGQRDGIVPLSEVCERRAGGPCPASLQPSPDASYHPFQVIIETDKKAKERRQLALKRLWADMGKFDPELKGETFFDIAKRLLSFYRKAGETRNFARAVGAIRQDVGKMAGAVRSTAVAQTDQARGELGARVLRMDSRTGRELLRRKVEQWTHGYEYEQLSLRLLAPTRPAWKIIRNRYIKAEKDLMAVFWGQCDELQAICQEPRTARERQHCIQCAETAMRYHCIEGKDEHGGCRGVYEEPRARRVTRVGPHVASANLRSSDVKLAPSGNRFAVWIAIETLAETKSEYHAGATDDDELLTNAIRDLVSRKFFPNKPDPKEFKSKEGLRYLDALPITAWQRCVLLNPYHEGSRDPNHCNLEEVKDKAKNLKKGEDIPWEKARLFRWVLAASEVKTLLKGTIIDYPCKGGGCAARLKRTRENADRFFGRGFASDKGLDAKGRLKSAGSAIGAKLGPLVGKILGMLLKAAGMYETMKTLARASGITPAQGADCEDQEYRRDVMKLAGGEDNKRGCLLKVFAKNFGNVLESIIVMLGNQIVDWGIALLRTALQGLKSSLISAAGSVPFAGGFLAMLVDVGWELLMNFGARTLLKTFVVAKLPIWLKIRELADLPFKALMAHPIVQVVAGIILQLIESAMTYGEKSWMAVGIDTALRIIQDKLRGNWLWYRALVYARKEMRAEASESEGLLDQLRRLAKAMIRGVVKVLARRLKPEWADRMLGLIDKLEGRVTDLIKGAGPFQGNPVGLLREIVVKDLGPLVLPIVSSMLPIPDWAKETLGAAAEKIYAIIVEKRSPPARDLLKLLVRPIGAAIERLSFGNALGRRIADGIDWAIDNLGALKSQFFDKPWRIAGAVLALVDAFVRDRADELVERMKGWSPALRAPQAQASVKALLKKGLTVVARLLAKTTTTQGGKPLGNGELLIALGGAIAKEKDSTPLREAEWKGLSRQKGGLLLVHVVKELVGQLLPAGPLGDLVRGLVDSVALLLTHPSNFSGAGVAKFLSSLGDVVTAFCRKVLLGRLQGVAHSVAKALIDAGLDLLREAKTGAQLLGRAKGLLGSLVRSLMGGLTKKLGSLGTVLTTAATRALDKWR